MDELREYIEQVRQTWLDGDYDNKSIYLSSRDKAIQNERNQTVIKVLNDLLKFKIPQSTDESA